MTWHPRTPGIIELHTGSQDNGVDLPGLHLVFGIQIDRVGRTYLEALTAMGTGLFVDEQHLRGIMRDRLVDCLPLGQPLVELILDLDRTDVDAFPHLVADGRVDVAALFSS